MEGTFTPLDMKFWGVLRETVRGSNNHSQSPALEMP